MPKTNKISNFLAKQLKLTKELSAVNLDEKETLQSKLELEINTSMKTIEHITKEFRAEKQKKHPLKNNLKRYERILKQKQQKIDELDNELEKLTMKDWEKVNPSQLQKNAEEEDFVILDNNTKEEDFVIVEAINSADDWTILNSVPSTSNNAI